MKTIVIYKSKSGFVKKYAEWIAEELSADIFEAKHLSIDKLLNYDTIIYGGGLYAVGINGIKIITKNFSKLKNKNIVVFACGASPFKEEILNEIKNNNFNPQQQNHISLFYMRGGFDYNKLNLIDKVIMQLLKFHLKRKSNLTPAEKGMLSAYTNPVDFTRKKNIEKLIEYVNSIKY
ncbi:flavodoxin [Crassaminicella thermophila]|uniref:Flavodoxin n=1 Tax=Crassaminicella thermophila TaxID=2599308 RepID=A0A5C0SEL7_CRATE|nr:flavodoxin domain-containing protein [Crassaminicella thermophila]QEK11734.1 flavodoxin [Crassaminicella thermophila]